MIGFSQLEMKFTPTLFTLGCDEHSPEEIEELLVSNSVRDLLDIRRTPDSADRPLRREGLKKICEKDGIRYQWEISLTNVSRDPRVVDLTNENSGLRTLLALLKRNGSVCLLCSEFDPERCHRSYISNNLLKKIEIDVVHL